MNLGLTWIPQGQGDNASSQIDWQMTPADSPETWQGQSIDTGAGTTTVILQWDNDAHTYVLTIPEYNVTSHASFSCGPFHALFASVTINGVTYDVAVNG